MSLDVHVVTHTHWDREWYHPLERFRQRLVHLIDEVLDVPPGAGESFLLDGQAVVLEDYLAVRPERREELAALLRDGRVEAGPWYVLADELLPSGEALVRNLFAGRQVLDRFGVASPPVLYCPDSFGHPAALPAIAAGFGFPLVLLWRGFGGTRSPAGDTVRWLGADGSAVLLYHLPRGGYEVGSNLPADPGGAAARWGTLRAELEPRSRTGVVYLPNGADHHARQVGRDAAVRALVEASSSDNMHSSSLARFSVALADRARRIALPVVRGELRDSYGYTWTLQGTFATRAHEKRMNATAERLLVRDAEPWAALAAAMAKPHELKSARTWFRTPRTTARQALVSTAWRTLLEAHPHDTLCGCSIDAVARAMEQRVESAREQAVGVRDDAILELIGHDPVVARTSFDRWTPIALFRNPAARNRSGVAIIDVDELIAHVPVGPGSGGGPSVEAEAAAERKQPLGQLGIAGLDLLQVLESRIVHSLTESPRAYPDNDLIWSTRVAVWVDEMPAYGIVGRVIGRETADQAALDRVPVATRRDPEHPVSTTGNSITNGLISLAVDTAGRVTLDHAASGRTVQSLLEWVDEADVGDTYTPAPRPREHRVEFRGVTRTHRGPLRGELVARYRIVSNDGARVAIDAELSVALSVDAASPFVRMSIVGENHRENHRLRIRVRSDVRDAAVWADAAFGTVQRRALTLPPNEQAVEFAPPTAPLHRHVSLDGTSNEAAAGLTVLSDGLAEYEATDDGAILVTLVRSVGELSRNDIPERPGHAGWPRPTPGAQCLGPFGAELGVFMHGGRDAATIDTIEHATEDFLLPVTGTTLRSALAFPAMVSGPQLIGAGLAFSALTESQNGEWLVLRCVNLLDDTVHGEWELPFAPTAAATARMDETVIDDLAVNGRRVAFEARPHAVVTVLARVDD